MKCEGKHGCPIGMKGTSKYCTACLITTPSEETLKVIDNEKWVRCPNCQQEQEKNHYALTDNKETAKKYGKQCVFCGFRFSVSESRKIECPQCQGTGLVNITDDIKEKCVYCNGGGKVLKADAEFIRVHVGG